MLQYPYPITYLQCSTYKLPLSWLPYSPASQTFSFRIRLICPRRPNDIPAGYWICLGLELVLCTWVFLNETKPWNWPMPPSENLCFKTQWPVSLIHLLNTTTRTPFEILFAMLMAAIVFPFALWIPCLHKNEKTAKYSGSCIQLM